MDDPFQPEPVDRLLRQDALVAVLEAELDDAFDAAICEVIDVLMAQEERSFAAREAADHDLTAMRDAHDALIAADPRTTPWEVMVGLLTQVGVTPTEGQRLGWQHLAETDPEARVDQLRAAIEHEQGRIGTLLDKAKAAETAAADPTAIAFAQALDQAEVLGRRAAEEGQPPAGGETPEDRALRVERSIQRYANMVVDVPVKWPPEAVAAAKALIGRDDHRLLTEAGKAGTGFGDAMRILTECADIEEANEVAIGQLEAAAIDDAGDLRNVDATLGLLEPSVRELEGGIELHLADLDALIGSVGPWRIAPWYALQAERVRAQMFGPGSGRDLVVPPLEEVLRRGLGRITIVGTDPAATGTSTTDGPSDTVPAAAAQAPAVDQRPAPPIAITRRRIVPPAPLPPATDAGVDKPGVPRRLSEETRRRYVGIGDWVFDNDVPEYMTPEQQAMKELQLDIQRLMHELEGAARG